MVFNLNDVCAEQIHRPPSNANEQLLSDSRASVSLGELEVTEGGSAILPCDMSLPSLDDAIYLVVWFLEPNKKPIYTFDARGKPLSMGRRWSEVVSFGLRADFRFALHGQIPSKGHLIINGTTLSDEGIYRCRVDFKNSPARHFRVQLNVTVPPSEPKITDETGREVRSSKFGPLRERQWAVLQCHVTGGKPSPEVEWYSNGKRFASSTGLEMHNGLQLGLLNDQQIDYYPFLQQRTIVREIRIGPLNRSHQDARFTCKASNSVNNAPKTKTVALDIHLPPLKVDISRMETRFVAGEGSEIRCQTFGSRPAASISWCKDDVCLPDSSYKVFDDENGNLTTSLFRANFSKEDHGKPLTCRASNRLLQASAIEDSIRLDVQFAPMATLRLGPTFKADSIKEGDDVYFECAIQANPNVTRLVWKHEDRILVYNASAKIIMSNQSLVLRGLTRQRSGHYKCVGVNARGEGSSNLVLLTVRYTPVCRYPVTNIRGAERGEFLNLSCSVDALPRPLKYKWALNTTRGWKEISTGSSSSAGTIPLAILATSSNEEILRFRPELEADFGTLACWAYSDLGWQQDPCLFRFFPAGPPESLSNCSVLNQTADSIQVSCSPNDDGGLKQTFQLQAMDVMTGQPQLTLQSDTVAEFWLTDLEPGSTFMLYLYAVNVKGLSQPVVLPVSTLKEAAKRTVPPSTDPFSGRVAGAVAMGAGAGFLLLTTVVVVACLRCRRTRNDATMAMTSSTGLAGQGQYHQQIQLHSNGINRQSAKSRPVHTNGELVSEKPTESFTAHEDHGTAGFYPRPARTSAAPYVGSKGNCLKLPPDYVATMSGAPESCV